MAIDTLNLRHMTIALTLIQKMNGIFMSCLMPTYRIIINRFQRLHCDGRSIASILRTSRATCKA